MLTLINLNRMVPPIAPIALDYLSGTARGARLSVDLLDLGLAADPRMPWPPTSAGNNPS